MGLVYVDSCVLIYAMEQDPLFGEAARNCLASQLAQNLQLAISPMVQLECLVHPLARQQGELIIRYQAWLQTFQWLSINDTTFARATELRASHGLKTPDALHLATALQHGCVALISNDKRLEKVGADLQCLSISAAQ
jgi:predicted nucleic acid-binding protein